MPASDAELAQLKAYADAMRQLIEAIEARYKAERAAPSDDGAPAARAARLR